MQNWQTDIKKERKKFREEYKKKRKRITNKQQRIRTCTCPNNFGQRMRLYSEEHSQICPRTHVVWGKEYDLVTLYTHHDHTFHHSNHGYSIRSVCLSKGIMYWANSRYSSFWKHTVLKWNRLTRFSPSGFLCVPYPAPFSAKDIFNKTCKQYVDVKWLGLLI